MSIDVIIHDMEYTRKAKTLSLDRDLLAEITRTKGPHSESERVNRLLRFALELERRTELEQEAARFYASRPDDGGERRAFEAAGISSWSRD
ncbi:MAG: hypothetical protein ABI995_13755 [Acidobacteriota bacterium]